MIPLFSSQQVRDADKYAVEQLGIPSIVLMENASRSIYDIMMKYSKYFNNNCFGIVCGKGNNGGDGFALARHLLINGFNIKLISLGTEQNLFGDALFNFNITRNFLAEYPKSEMKVFSSLRDLRILNNCSVIVDAILGTGSKGILAEPISEIISYLNSLKTFKVAIDVPTGLNLENSVGELIFKADLTVTLSEFKTGLFYHNGYSNCGIVEKGSIGIGDSYYNKLLTKDYLVEPEDALLALPDKKINANKYSAGKVLVIAGSGKYPGAACLTANSVLSSGAGACFLAFPKSIKHSAQKKLQEAIVLSYDDKNSEILSLENLAELNDKIKWADVIAIGPGLGREETTLSAVRKIISTNKTKPIVIDADAVYALSDNFYRKINLQNKVLTPHHKEFADLINVNLNELQNNLTKYGKEFSSQNKCWLVLKGAPTISFNPNGEMFINSTGNAGMAKFGTGDVLTGVIASFIAQSKEIESSVIGSVYFHSLAADLLMYKKTEYSFTANDIIKEFPNAIKFIRKTFTQ